MLIHPKSAPIILKLCQHNWDKPSLDLYLYIVKSVAIIITDFTDIAI